MYLLINDYTIKTLQPTGRENEKVTAIKKENKMSHNDLEI